MSTFSNLNSENSNCKDCCKSLPLSIFAINRDPNDPKYPIDIYPMPTYLTVCEPDSYGNRKPVDRDGNLIPSSLANTLGNQVASMFGVGSKCEEDLKNLFDQMFQQQMRSILFNCGAFPDHCIVWRVLTSSGGPVSGGSNEITVCCDCNGLTAYDTILIVQGFLIPCGDIDDWLNGTISYPPGPR